MSKTVDTQRNLKYCEKKYGGEEKKKIWRLQRQKANEIQS